MRVNLLTCSRLRAACTFITSIAPALALLTVTPWRCTCSGRKGVASDSLFWTCTCAMSGSVPGRNASVRDADPLELDVELI